MSHRYVILVVFKELGMLVLVWPPKFVFLGSSIKLPFYFFQIFSKLAITVNGPGRSLGNKFGAL